MIKEVFQAAVKARINGDKKHGWGVDDSHEVILALIADETGATVEDLKKESPDLVNAIKEVINPSQFRQKLETAKILDKGSTKADKVNSLLTDFQA